MPTSARCRGPQLGRETLRNDGNRSKPVREENPRAAWIPAVHPRVRESLLLTTDQLVAIASAPSEPPLIRGNNQRRWRRRSFAPMTEPRLG
jgi:hypothetical protein